MSSKKKTSQTSTTQKSAEKALGPAAHSSQLSLISSASRFLQVLVGSLLLSTLFFSLTAPLNRDDLAIISKRFDGWSEVGALLAWRSIEIGISWVLGFDSKWEPQHPSLVLKRKHRLITNRNLYLQAEMLLHSYFSLISQPIPCYTSSTVSGLRRSSYLS